MMNDYGQPVPEPRTVPATAALLELLATSEFAVLDDFHPAFSGSITLVHPPTGSAITLVVVESDE